MSPDHPVRRSGSPAASRRRAFRVGVSNSTTAGCWPARGAPIVTTVAVHGPSPGGSASELAGPTACGEARDRPATRSTPMAMMLNQRAAVALRLVGPRRDRASDAAMPPPARNAMAMIPAAEPPRTRRAPAIAPIASQPLAGMSAHGHEIAEAVEGLLADQLAVAQVVDLHERLGFARADDLRGGHRSDAGQRVEFSRRRSIDIDQAAGRRPATSRRTGARGTRMRRRPAAHRHATAPAGAGRP